MRSSTQRVRKRYVRVVLQARTTSSRLPAKSLLPLGGMPLAVLCARRLMRAGGDVVMATSDDPADDFLAATAVRAGITTFRGSHFDVLARFVACVEGLSGDDIVVRMTADNPIPDGDFVGCLVDAFVAQHVAYLGTRWPEDGLPYGVGGEVFTVSALRGAQHGATSYESEHVTPGLAAGGHVGTLANHQLEVDCDRASARCTIDSLDDYLAMARVFRNVSDPINADWRSLVRLMPHQQSGRVPYSTENEERCTGKIVIGTAQFGMDYGIANQTGRPSDEEIDAIVRIAAGAGATHIDTARGYGDAERRLGSLLLDEQLSRMRIISKVAPLTSLARTANRAAVADLVDASVFRSCYELRRRRVDVMMLHRFKDMLQWNGAALSRLVALREDGVVGAIGVSVYSPSEAIRCLADKRVSHLQIPFNLLDARWLGEEFQAAVRERPDVTVHVRSVFLQGLLINRPHVWPSWFKPAEQFANTIVRLCGDLHRLSPADLCLAYVRSCPWITTLVLGAETSVQMDQLVTLIARAPLSQCEATAVRDMFRDVPARILNPAKW